MTNAKEVGGNIVAQYKSALTSSLFIKKVCVENNTFTSDKEGAFKTVCECEEKKMIVKRFNRSYLEEKGWTPSTIPQNAYDNDIYKCFQAKQYLNAYRAASQDNFYLKYILNEIMTRMHITMEWKYIDTYKMKITDTATKQTYWAQGEKNCSVENMVFQKLLRNDLVGADTLVAIFIEEQAAVYGRSGGSLHWLLMYINVLLFIYYTYITQSSAIILDIQGCISIKKNNIKLVLTDPDIIKGTGGTIFTLWFKSLFANVIRTLKREIISDGYTIPLGLSMFIDSLEIIFRNSVNAARKNLINNPGYCKSNFRGVITEVNKINRFEGNVVRTKKESELEITKIKPSVFPSKTPMGFLSAARSDPSASASSFSSVARTGYFAPAPIIHPKPSISFSSASAAAAASPAASASASPAERWGPATNPSAYTHPSGTTWDNFLQTQGYIHYFGDFQYYSPLQNVFFDITQQVFYDNNKKIYYRLGQELGPYYTDWPLNPLNMWRGSAVPAHAHAVPVHAYAVPVHAPAVPVHAPVVTAVGYNWMNKTFAELDFPYLAEHSLVAGDLSSKTPVSLGINTLEKPEMAMNKLLVENLMLHDGEGDVLNQQKVLFDYRNPDLGGFIFQLEQIFKKNAVLRQDFKKFVGYCRWNSEGVLTGWWNLLASRHGW